MTKTEKYYKTIQKIAIESSTLSDFLDKVDIFLNTQTLLKRNKIKKLNDKVKIYFIEYINHKLQKEFFENNPSSQDIFTFLYYKISDASLRIKTICADDIASCVILNRKDKINSIIINGYEEKQRKIKEYEFKISKLKEGML